MRGRKVKQNRKVLLLNKGESVIDVIDWKDAACLMVKGQVSAPFEYEDHYHEIKTAKGIYKLPKAVVLNSYVHIPYKKAAVNRKNVMKRDEHTCGYCGKHLNESTGSIDHIIPRSRWDELKRKNKTTGYGKFANNWKNVVASCRTCNTKKDDRTPQEANMKLYHKPFVPSKNYLIFKSVEKSFLAFWERWIGSEHLEAVQAK